MEYLAPWPAEDEGAAASPPKGWAPHRRPRLPCRLFFTAFGKTLPMAHCNKLHDFAHKITIFSRDNTPEPSVRERVTVQCIRVWGRAHLLAFFWPQIWEYGLTTYSRVSFRWTLSDLGNEASRGLSATAEFLVLTLMWSYSVYVDRDDRRQKS